MMSDTSFEEGSGVSTPSFASSTVDTSSSTTLSEEKVDPGRLTMEMVGPALSELSRTGNGLAHAYIRLELYRKDLTDISVLSDMVHVRFLDLSGNRLTDLSPLNSMNHLLWLKADRNPLTKINMDERLFLQVASFAYNQINTLEGLSHPQLRILNVTGNRLQRISGLDPSKLRALTTLELRGNGLESTEGLCLPSLRELYLAANKLEKIEGLRKMPNLKLLHLRDNVISSLTGFTSGMKTLQYLNLRGNQIMTVKEVDKLHHLHSLRTLSLAGNPLAEEEAEHYVLDALSYVPSLIRVDKHPVSEEDRSEAEALAELRRRELSSSDSLAHLPHEQMFSSASSEFSSDMI
ncbi:leucine-rich repeat-containing protein 23-like [Branchiostoma lanceolatum]|uniref:leucine-rich repeat-containing protein 23-like n=1 Tax=Branchiostoma lanceolatum TaxID=7740 RepID=UPI003453C9B3